MPDEDGDFLRDPNFPNRPQTPAFWKLSEVILQNDGAFEDPDQNSAIFEHLVNGVGIDIDSLAYVANQRGLRLISITGAEPTDALRQFAIAIWMDAFVHGYKFRQRIESDTPPV